jgi:fibronectin type 3 domain-containing protein
LLVVKAVKADVEEAQKPGTIHEAAAETIETSKIPSRQTTSITVPQAHPSPGRELYYTSARSLASSYVPTVGSYGVGSRGGSAGGHMSSSYLLPHMGSITSDPLVVGSHPVRARSGPVGTSVSNLISTVEFPLLFASSGSQLGTCYLPTVSNVMRSLQNGTIDELMISGSFLLVWCS